MLIKIVLSDLSVTYVYRQAYKILDYYYPLNILYTAL